MNLQEIKAFLKCLLHPRQCQRMHKLLFEFVEGELDEATRMKLESHLGDCPKCLEFVDTYRRTIEATHCHCRPAANMPEELQRKLQEFIKQNPNLG